MRSVFFPNTAPATVEVSPCARFTRTVSEFKKSDGRLERSSTKKDQLAWRVHHEFITVHPFIEANGRMARLLMNLVRLRAGLDVAIVRFEDREKYSKAIVEFQQHKLAKASNLGSVSNRLKQDPS